MVAEVVRNVLVGGAVLVALQAFFVVPGLIMARLLDTSSALGFAYWVLIVLFTFAAYLVGGLTTDYLEETRRGR